MVRVTTPEPTTPHAPAPAPPPSPAAAGAKAVPDPAAQPIAVTPLLREFARIRFERPGLDDAEAFDLAARSALSSRSHEDPVEHR